ncbi:trypsin delta-like [Schistocerca cancellata]|uniref:trypsin delta-like n=1 Tax=Schistocerca cancellata TaxID=274614 RepID=UPI002117EB30|nr:trypsin delta-like [Schistocerca cancellata]
MSRPATVTWSPCLWLLLLSAAAAWPSAVWQRTGAHERIVGGHETSIADLPWQLAFELGGDQRCGASLIGDSWVLTAGYCVEDVKLDYLALRAGSSVRGDAQIYTAYTSTITTSWHLSPLTVKKQFSAANSINHPSLTGIDGTHSQRK